MTMTAKQANGHHPKPKYFREKIGDTEFELREEKLDVFDEVTLWSENPRLQLFQQESDVSSEEELQARLKATNGYDVLERSIREVGQLEPIYVWKNENMKKYIVLEGATRVTILRELSQKAKGTSTEADWRRVTVKVLPETFTVEQRVILLARIHVRGSGVRAWGRYIEAKFIHDHVTEHNGQKPVTTVRELARYMGKSDSWVSRLKDAYEFARRFVEYVDSPDAEKLAASHFSTLEEISKAAGFGSLVKDYDHPEHSKLREEVFEMVRNDVFKEYRDARFIKNFWEDPSKWEQLKTHEKFIANKLANEERTGGVGSLTGKIAALPASIARALDRDPESITERELESLQKAVREVEARLPGIGVFRLQLNSFKTALLEAPLSEVKSITRQEWEDLKEGMDDLDQRLTKYADWRKV